jgi:hypothetical protein
LGNEMQGRADLLVFEVRVHRISWKPS